MLKILNAVKKICMVQNSYEEAKYKPAMCVSALAHPSIHVSKDVAKNALVRTSAVIIACLAACLAVCLAMCSTASLPAYAIFANFTDSPVENSHQYQQNPIIQTTHTASTTAFIQSDSVARYVLASIRNARSRLYDNRGTYFNGMPLQDYVSRCGLSKEAYVNNIQYDAANEQDAFRRAQETAQHGKFGHFGPDGVSAPDYTGRKAWAENLSWGVDLAGSMQLWIQNEESALRATGGAFSEDNGHLYQILNPSNISFGYGEASGGPYGVVGALTLSEYNGDIDYPDGKIGPESPEEQKKRAEEEQKKKEEQQRKDEEAKKKVVAHEKHGRRVKHKHHKKFASAMKKSSVTHGFMPFVIVLSSALVSCVVAVVAWIFLRHHLVAKRRFAKHSLVAKHC